MAGYRKRLLRSLGGPAGALLLSMLIAVVSMPARAYDDVPHRAARLSYLEGNVTVQRVDNTGSDAAQRNMPLLQGQRVTTGDSGMAEMEFEDGSVVRLTPNSSIALNNLSIDAAGNFQTQLAVTNGLIYAELRATTRYIYLIEAGGDTITPVQNTTVRIDVDHPPVVVSTLTGTVRVERASSQEDGSYRTDVRAGESLTADGSDSSRYFLAQQIVPDSWDSWNEARDQAAADESIKRTSARDNYAGDQGYGWSDLDSNGSWYDVPGEGQVWQPAVAQDPGFDPYGYGSWVWSGGAGYIWASGYSWGWTPYRCGNWSFLGGFGWGWLPASNCGLGWGFGGGRIYTINIIRPPSGYHFRPLPSHDPGRVHPIVVVHSGTLPSVPVHPPQAIRTFAGHTLRPLPPVGGAYTPRGGSALGSSLHRDFPVDRVNHRPEMGYTGRPGRAPATTPASTPSFGSDWKSGTSRPVTSKQGNVTAPLTPAPPLGGQIVQPFPSQHPDRHVDRSMDRRLDSTPAVHPSQGYPVSPAIPAMQDSSRSHPVSPNPVARPITPTPRPEAIQWSRPAAPAVPASPHPVTQPAAPHSVSPQSAPVTPGGNNH